MIECRKLIFPDKNHTSRKPNVCTWNTKKKCSFEIVLRSNLKQTCTATLQRFTSCDSDKSSYQLITLGISRSRRMKKIKNTRFVNAIYSKNKKNYHRLYETCCNPSIFVKKKYCSENARSMLNYSFRNKLVKKRVAKKSNVTTEMSANKR